MKVLLISSSGGHWVQMRRLLPAFVGHEVIFASTDKDYHQHLDAGTYHSIPDASMWNKPRLIWQALSVLFLILRTQPAVVLTTGASAGFFALLFAKMLGRKTIWLDSIANYDELSLSGQKVGRFADLYLTQWPHLAHSGGPEYAGSVL